MDAVTQNMLTVCSENQLSYSQFPLFLHLKYRVYNVKDFTETKFIIPSLKKWFPTCSLSNTMGIPTPLVSWWIEYTIKLSVGSYFCLAGASFYFLSI